MEEDALAHNNYERLRKMLKGSVASVMRAGGPNGREEYIIEVVRRKPHYRETDLIISVIEDGPNKGRILVEIGRKTRDTHRNNRKQKGPDEPGPG